MGTSEVCASASMSSKRRRLDSVGRCALCDKAMFPSRKAAREAIGRIPGRSPGAKMNAYRCKENENYWHIGHLPTAVRRGFVSRDVL